MSAPLQIWHRSNPLGNADALEHYWTADPDGLSKWAVTRYPFNALRKHLAKYVADPDGLAATYYHVVFGKWPAKSKAKRKIKRLGK